MCPGLQDYVIEYIDGVKVKQQKRLLLANLKDLFILYREHSNHIIGFSQFCELRPKFCVTPGSQGVHSVCVCAIHQNTKLMFSVTGCRLDYQDMMAKVVCEIQSTECKLHRSPYCPGTEGVTHAIEDV